MKVKDVCEQKQGCSPWQVFANTHYIVTLWPVPSLVVKVQDLLNDDPIYDEQLAEMKKQPRPKQSVGELKAIAQTLRAISQACGDLADVYAGWAVPPAE